MTFDFRLSTFNNRCAFSLAELAIVLALVAILAAMIVPRFSHSLVHQRVNAAHRRVLTDLNYARLRAIRLGGPQTVTFQVPNDRYVLVGLKDFDHPTVDYTVKLAEEPFRATVVSADFNGDSTIIFDAYGVPDSGGAVVLAVGDQQKTVTVDAITGRAR